MRPLAKNLLFEDTHDSLTRVLQSWRLWLVGALVGAVLAAGVFVLAPPQYRATAVVVVDLNIEEAWPIGPDSQVFFLTRESRKLEQLAWSDETLQQVADQVGDVSVLQLRGEVLQLSQPADGGWQFIARSGSPDRAAQIATAWAEAFTRQVAAGIELSAQWEQERQEVVRILQSDPDMTINDARKLVDRIAPAIGDSKGISPFVELFIAQSENIPVERTVSLSVFLLIGSAIGAFGLAFLTLFYVRIKGENVRVAE